MFSSDPAAHLHFWHLITRLGEAHIVLPLALLTAANRARDPEARPGALRWLTQLGIAILLTTVSKVAFIGWGVGSAALNFTGISGHSMFAAAVYPPLISTIAGGPSARARRLAIIAGCTVALLVGVSRVVLETHSLSEIAAGLFAGALVCVGVMARGTSVPARLDFTIVAAAVLWMALISSTAPAFNTHSLVTRIALKLSGHKQPYTREALLSRHV